MIVPYNILLSRIETVGKNDFDALALDVFRYQATHNPLYKTYLRLLGKDTTKIDTIDQIPFLPISFFKTHRIQTEKWDVQATFRSSGTTGAQTSEHHLRDTRFYTHNSLRAFEHFYGEIEDFCVLALLPSYLERTDSSLVYMTQQFISRSKYPESGFFLNNINALSAQVAYNQAQKIPTLLLGVTFALLDLAQAAPQNLSDIIIMETGGMKGKRKELTRAEVHILLCEAFQTPLIHAEYGMTELLSQAYSKGNGVFESAPTMRIYVRDPTDPFAFLQNDRPGGINIIDLANLATCSFIATDDLGKTHENGAFEIIGRLDTSDIRGCNLLAID